MSLTIPYTIFVHVIEARDLRGKDSNNLSDPYVVVSCHGQSQRTEITRNQVNVLWDRMFVFQDVLLNKDEFERDNIHLQVFDANIIMRNTLIGQFSFGIQKVWSQPKPTAHQFYKKWVILTDPEDAYEQMGFILTSVTVLGPGDSPPTHGPNEFIEPEVLRAPLGLTNTRRGYNMMVKIYRGEEIASDDGSEGGSDPFLSVKFNGIVMRTQPEYATTQPEWNTLLVFPVFTPCLTDNIDVQLWAYKARSPDVLIATHRIKFSDLLSNQMYPTWINLYRLPYSERSGMFATGGEGQLSEYSDYTGRIQLAISTSITDDPIMEERACRPVALPPTSEWHLHCDIHMASGLAKLMGWSGADIWIEIVWGSQKVQTEPGVLDERDESNERLLFSTYGAGNNEFYDENNDEPTNPGVCQLKTIAQQLPRLELNDIDLKWDQLPDIMVNVMSGNQRVGYIRYDAQTLYKKSNSANPKPNEVWYDPKPEWSPIRGMAASGKVRSIGFLLFHMCLGQMQRGDSPPERIEMDEKLKDQATYHVRAHVYMARNLRAANENGLSSTYVEVSIGGKALSLLTPQRRNTYDAEDEDIEDVSATVSEGQDVMDAANCMWQSSKHKQTAVAEDTLNPVWMQTLYSQEKLIVDDSAEPNSIQALTYAPDIVLTVYNRDNAGKEDFVGRCNFPTVLALSNGKTQEMQYWPGENTMNVNPYDENNTKRPIWLQLRAGDLTLSRTSVKEDKGKADSSIYGTNNDCEGEILVWFEVIPEEAWEALQEMELDEKEGGRSLDVGHNWPGTTACEIHLVSLGMRNLEPFGLGDVTSPSYMVFAPNFPDRNVMREKLLENAPKDESSSDDDESAGGNSSDDDSGPDEEGNGGGKNEGKGGASGWKNHATGNDSSEDDNSDQEEDTYETSMYGNPDGDRETTISATKADDTMPKLHGSIVRWRSVEDLKHDERDAVGKSVHHQDGDSKGGSAVGGQVQFLPANSSPFHFHEIRMRVELPDDPFYCGSMTILVKDTRGVLWSSDIAVGTSNIPLVDHVLPVPISSRKYFGSDDNEATIFYSPEQVNLAKKIGVTALKTFWHLEDKINVMGDSDNEDGLEDGDGGGDGGMGETKGHSPSNGSNFGMGETKGDLPARSSNQEQEEEEEESEDGDPDASIFQFRICLDEDEINMVFDEEITDFKVQLGEDFEEMDNETREGGGGDDDDEDAVYWPGDFEEKEEALGRKTLTGTIEEEPTYQPDYSTFKLYRGSNREDEGKGRDIVDRQVGVFKAFLRIWPLSENVNPKTQRYRSYDQPPHEPRWFNTKASGAADEDDGAFGAAGGDDDEGDAGGPSAKNRRKPENLWLSNLNHGVKIDGTSKFPGGNGTEKLKVRIYCMKAHSLAPMRAGNSSNPFLELNLIIPKGDIFDKVYNGEVPGLFAFSDDANYKTNTIEPDFNAWYEMDAILPGISTLEIAIKDHGYVRNTLIGSTRIDLEDRWFSRAWRAAKDIQQVPRESRVLTNPTTRIPQGTLECWIEMYEPSIAVDIPVVPIAPPKVTEWEMRVVIWETRKVPRLRDKRSMNMYSVGEFIYFSAEDSTRGPQQLHETDVHGGVRDGNGKFNWRMKYLVQVPCKHPRLRVQIYDHDMFSLDGFACETVINLEQLFREALISQDEVRRPKKHFRLSSSNHLGESRGEIDLQINLMPVSLAEKNPVGNARDKPNEDPFLPDPIRKRSGMFDSPIFRYLKMLFCLGIFVGLGVLGVTVMLSG